MNGLLAHAGIATLVAFIAFAVCSAGSARSQGTNPVYVDDSPQAAQSLAQVASLVAGGNEAEAVRALQRLLETDAERLIADPDDREVFLSVRSRVHAALLGSPVLLDRYRRTTGPLARRFVEQGEAARVEREMLLTEAGFDAAIAVALDSFRRADFDGARLTLLQLGTHPDLMGRRADQAAELLADIARFRVSEQDLQTARSWSSRVPAELVAIDAPRSALQSGDAGFTPLGPLSTAEPLERPLRSAGYGIAPGAAAMNQGAPSSDGAGSADDPTESTPWVLPAVAGDALLINNGAQIDCFDATTLERRWVYSPAAGREPTAARRRVRSQTIDDTMTVTAGGGVAVATLGDTAGRQRRGNGRLHAVRLDNGERLWSLGPTSIRSDLAGAIFHGPAVISGDTVVVGLFTFAPLRRVHLCHLVGLDLYTGETRWVRLVATSGVMPSQRGPGTSPAMRVVDGIVYRVSPLGVMTAVEAAAGRTRWTRLVASMILARGAESNAWLQRAPMIRGNTIAAIEPDGQRLTVIDRATGRMIGNRPTADLRWPDYALRVGDDAVFVGQSGYATLAFDELLSGTPRLIERTERPRSGRAVVAGPLVLEPSERGMHLVDPAGGEARHIRLDRSGSPAIANGQLLVVDPRRAHGYLDWPTARAELLARVESSPAEPVHAIALAELAFRAGDAAAIAPAAQAALEAIDRAERAEPDRRRLYSSLFGMLEAGSIDDQDQRGGVLEVLDAAALTAGERVGVIMQKGLWHRDAGRHRQAVEQFQSILDDRTLAAALYGSAWRTERADRAAISAIGAVLRTHDAEAYSPFADLARGEMSRLASDPATTGERFESVARRFPFAPSATAAWRAAAAAYAEQGQSRRARAALHAGMDAAQRLQQSGDDTAELAGLLSESLVAEDRVFAALRLIRATDRMTRRGEPIDTASLEASLLEALGARDRAPRTGPAPRAMVQMIGGWQPVAPLSRAGPRATSHLMMRSERLGRLALWTARLDAAAGAIPTEPGNDSDGADDADGFDWRASTITSADAAASLAPAWSRPLGVDAQSEPVLVSLSPTRALLYHGSYENARFESIDTVTGETAWAAPAFRTLFDSRPERYDTGVLETPLDGQVWLRDHLIVVSRRHVGIVERFGRAAIFERSSGTLVFARQLDVPMVYEASLRGGVLAVVGERPGDPRRNEGEGVVPQAAAYDVASGNVVFGPEEFRTARSFGRWVRLVDERTMLVGLDLGVVGVDLARGQIAWTVDDPAVRLSGDCLLGAGRAYIIGLDRQLWQLDLARGALVDEPLEDLGRLMRAQRFTYQPTADDGLVFASDAGLAVFAQDGRLIGGDAFDTRTALCEPVLTESGVLTLSRRPEPAAAEPAIAEARQRDDGDDDADAGAGTGGGLPYRLTTMQLPDGRITHERSLVLHSTPRSITALDDLLIVGIGLDTAVYLSPADPESAAAGGSSVGND